MRRHFTSGLLFGAVASAVTYADGARLVTTFVVGGLVAVAVWAVAYAVDRRH